MRAVENSARPIKLSNDQLMDTPIFSDDKTDQSGAIQLYSTDIGIGPTPFKRIEHEHKIHKVYEKEIDRLEREIDELIEDSP